MDKGESPRLDLLKIELPTDRITLGAMRRLEPQWFTGLDGTESHDILAIATMHLEKHLAEKAFAAAVGANDPHPKYKREFLVSMLGDTYQAYGISAGRKQSEELVRALERSAAKQAEDWRGRHR